MYSLKEVIPASIMSSSSLLTDGFQSDMDIWNP